MPEEVFETPQPIGPTMEPRSTDWMKIILAAVLGLGLLAGAAYAGYWYGTREISNLKNQIQPTPTASPTPLFETTPTPTPTVADETGGWKTYTNETTGYTIKIPRDWVVDDHKGVFVSISGEATFTPSSEIGTQGEEGDVFRTKVAILAMTTEKIRYNLNTKQQFDEWVVKDISRGEGERLFKTGNVKVGGFDAVRFVSRSLPGDPAGAYYGIVTWFRRDETNYYLELYSTNEKKASEFTSVYDQILSTFKFLEVEDQTKDWKTYTDTKSRFLLKYPDSYFKFQGDSSLLTFFAATSAPQGGNSPKFLGKNDVWLSAVGSSENATSLDQYLESAPDYYKNAQKTPVVIDCIDGLKMVYTLVVGPAEPLTPQYVYEVLVIKNGDLYAISMASWTKNILDSSQTLFDQILSTFKFLD